ncbi:hypothetical protein TNCT_186431 [Trichonephila clavata]|uniref:Uncharacterized protein n=1 Tax=Trichonephila clavata TaxID=2740835 RepID=A0A8X6FH15_TRICU|nr:hypothetical protein TNCT_186431 [Trichonephila clavata]
MHAIEGNRLGINAHRATIIEQEQNPQRIELLLKYGRGGIFSDLLERITLNIQEIKKVSALSSEYSNACSRPEWEITEQNSSDVINNLLENQ